MAHACNTQAPYGKNTLLLRLLQRPQRSVLSKTSRHSSLLDLHHQTGDEFRNTPKDPNAHQVDAATRDMSQPSIANTTITPVDGLLCPQSVPANPITHRVRILSLLVIMIFRSTYTTDRCPVQRIGRPAPTWHSYESTLPKASSGHRGALYRFRILPSRPHFTSRPAARGCEPSFPAKFEFDRSPPFVRRGTIQ